jgi:hypothetical protein
MTVSDNTTFGQRLRIARSVRRLTLADLERVVDTLWRVYGWCWPTPLMRRWFLRRLT